jgi:hypothetical protein
MVGLGHAARPQAGRAFRRHAPARGVARALAMSPEILLLDEPLSALDALTRAKLQDEIERIWSQGAQDGRADHQRRGRGDPAGRPHRAAQARPRRTLGRNSAWPAAPARPRRDEPTIRPSSACARAITAT